MRYLILLISFIISFCCFSQVKKDSIYKREKELSGVTVHSFNYRKDWIATPASVALVSANQLHLISNSSLLPSLNTVSGVRMEERSPASYRLSIRGSLLRSPFGVRNVKVYWNNMPLTDGGGNTYLNLIDIAQLSSVEIVKGPAANMYGAGTSGVVLLQSSNEFVDTTKNRYQVGITAGSYGMLQEHTSWKYQSNKISLSLLNSYQKSSGYRQQSASEKNNVTWGGATQFNHQQLQWITFYTRLFYETPGGITLAQMQQDPSLARQPMATLPGAVQQKAAIYNNTFFAGIRHIYNFNEKFYTDAAIVFHHTNFKNSFITNYEKEQRTILA